MLLLKEQHCISFFVVVDIFVAFSSNKNWIWVTVAKQFIHVVTQECAI